MLFRRSVVKMNAKSLSELIGLDGYAPLPRPFSVKQSDSRFFYIYITELTQHQLCCAESRLANKRVYIHINQRKPKCSTAPQCNFSPHSPQRSPLA